MTCTGQRSPATCANQSRSIWPRIPGALETTCASPCGNMTTSPAPSCTDGPPGMAAQHVPAATTWYSITCSTPRNRSGAICRAGGASATQPLLPLTEKKTAPRRRTLRRTSESVSWSIQCDPVFRSGRQDARSTAASARLQWRTEEQVATTPGRAREGTAPKNEFTRRQGSEGRLLHSQRGASHELTDLLYARPRCPAASRRRCRGARRANQRRARHRRRRRLRGRAQGLERHRRSSPGGDRSLPERERRAGGGPLRGRASHAAQRAQRRPSHRRQRRRRRRPDDRPLGDACRRRRRCQAHGARRRRRAAQGRRRGGAGARAGDAARHQLDHRRRRPHARRRLRLADAPARPDDRQPAERARRHGRRLGANGIGARGARAVLGVARRRRQLRRRHLVRVRPPSGRPRGLCRLRRLSVRAGAPGPARLARLLRHRARRAERLDGVAQGAAAAVPARVGARHRGRHLSDRLRRRHGSGQARRRADRTLRRPDRRRARADAVRRLPGRLRSAPHGGRSQLLEDEQLQPAERCRDRRGDRRSGEPARRRVRGLRRPARRRDGARRGRRDRIRRSRRELHHERARALV